MRLSRLEEARAACFLATEEVANLESQLRKARRRLQSARQRYDEALLETQGQLTLPFGEDEP